MNAIGSGTVRRNTVESDSTAVVMDVLKRTGPRRYIGMSAGIMAPLSFVFDHVIRPLFFSNLYREHLAVEGLIRRTTLDWTILRPTRLVHGPPRGYLAATERLPGFRASTARADVAAFILEELRTRQHLHQAVFIVSR